MNNKKNKTSVQQTLSTSEIDAINLQNRDVAVGLSMQGTVAGDIWNEIKNLNIDMFALPNQKVWMHCHPIMIEPTKLYLVTNSSAVLPSLETALGKNFNIELTTKFLIVTKLTK